MNSRGLSLSVKVGLAVLVISSVPAAVATLVAYTQSRELLQASIGENLGSQADRLSDELDVFHQAFIVRAGSLAGFQSLAASAAVDAPVEERQRAHDIIDTVMSKDPRLSGIAVVSEDGTIRVSNNHSMENTSAKSRPWFADRPSDTIAGALTVPSGGDVSDSVLDYTSPIKGGGFVIVSVRGEVFWTMVRQLTDRVYKDSYVVVLDGNGVRLGHGSVPTLVYRSSGPIEPSVLERMIRTQRYGPRTAELLKPVEEPLEYQWATAATGGDRTLKHFDSNGAGQGERMATSRRLKSVPWTVVSVVPQQALTQPVFDLLTGMLWRIGFILVAGFVISLFVAQRAIDPIKRLVDAASQLSRGQTPPPVDNSSTDEVGELVKQFNTMVTTTTNARAELESRVRERTRELTTANDELTVQQEELKAQQEELERKNREVERANQLKSAFLANMSHELRTPLNSVIGFSELLADDIGSTLDPRHRRYLNDVNASGKHLLRLINDILDLSKIEAGHLDLEVQAVPASEVVGQARALVGGSAITSKVNIIEEIHSKQRVLVDTEKLRQVMVNLLSNAVKFSPAGSEVRVGAEDVPGGVRFYVRDNGPGIDPSYMKRLFEPFVQGENPLTKRHQGTGLGLAISRRVVERHGSTLQVESEPGRGAYFYFVLPATIGETKPIIAGTSAVRPVVLLMEYDVRRGRALREALQDAQYEVASPLEHEALVDAARRLQPSVLVLAPSEDSKTIAQLAMLRTDQSLRKVPVVLTSAPHASGILAKPLDAEEIVSAVRRATGFGSGSVLVVDDDPRALDLISAVLSPRGYEVDTATGVTEALAKMRTKKPSVVLTDLLMPDITGFEFVETLAADPALKDIPVLVLSALELDENQRARLKRHVAAMARKGDITAIEVVEAVSRLTRPVSSPTPTPGSVENTILVVDDHDLNRQLARALLEKRGFRVIEASNGHEAVQMTRDYRPALVLMDLAMPTMDGFAALDGIRQQPALSTIPVVALTAMAMKSDQEAVHRAGFDGYLTKPIDAQRLDAEINRVLKRS